MSPARIAANSAVPAPTTAKISETKSPLTSLTPNGRGSSFIGSCENRLTNCAGLACAAMYGSRNVNRTTPGVSSVTSVTSTVWRPGK